jgi:hypothetical protein
MFLLKIRKNPETSGKIWKQPETSTKNHPTPNKDHPKSESPKVQPAGLGPLARCGGE